MFSVVVWVHKKNWRYIRHEQSVSFLHKFTHFLLPYITWNKDKSKILLLVDLKKKVWTSTQKELEMTNENYTTTVKLWSWKLNYCLENTKKKRKKNFWKFFFRKANDSPSTSKYLVRILRISYELPLLYIGLLWHPPSRISMFRIHMSANGHNKTES